MQFACASCGVSFEATSTRAKFCSGKCRKRAADVRKRAGTVVPLRAAAPLPKSEPASPGIGAAMLAEFPASVLESAQGALAMKVAADIDQAPVGAPGVASMVRELRGLIAELQTRTAPKQANPLVLLRERHADARASS